MVKINKKIKVVSKGGISIGQMGNNNNVVQNNTSNKRELPWVKITIAIISSIAIIIAAIIGNIRGIFGD